MGDTSTITSTSTSTRTATGTATSTSTGTSTVTPAPVTTAGPRATLGPAMSIIHSLKKLLDPNQARLEEAERKAKREIPKREASGDGGRFRCRVCGHEAEERAYCPTCLADTMEPIAKP